MAAAPDSLVAVPMTFAPRAASSSAIAPGLYLPRYQQSRYRSDLPNVEIVHGWEDDVVLYEHSLRFARDCNAPLHLLPGDHMLGAQIPALRALFALYLQRFAG